MYNMNNRSALFIVNPESQGGRTGKNWEKMYSKIKTKLNFPSEFEIADGIGKGIIRTEERLREEGFTDVIAVGGDGSINEVVNGIYNSGKDVNLGFIMSGSANDYLTNIDWPSDLDKQIELINGGNTMPTPISKVYGDVERVSMNVADTGIGALIAYSASVERRLKWIKGEFRYTLLSIRGIFKWKNLPITVITDDRSIEGDLSFFMAGFSKLSGGFIVLPHADRFGKKMAYTMATDLGKLRMIRLMGNLKTGDFSEDMKGVYLGHSSRITIKGDESLLFEVDGEPFSFDTNKITLESIPNKIRVFI